ncbi:MAG: adenine deaminase [Bacteroidetes bacterium]|jgi:adenine deaminase|nr:adenine deaminase [Bacteroidota bacterium]
MELEYNIIDIHKREIYPAKVIIEGKMIKDIIRIQKVVGNYIMPGLIDSHVHIESSLCTPGSFAMAVVSRGTTGIVSDPHEIANVMGLEGIEFMLKDAAKVPLKVWFGAPSCVPATAFESNGAVIDHTDLDKLLKRKEIKYLSEMMNFPGVISEDKDVLKKIMVAKKHGKPIDGHAPGLSGNDLKKYIDAGISTDHECSTLEEALEKLSKGMKIQIREGSAARNLDALKSLLNSHPEELMLCSDDMHPEMLAKRHINKVVSQLVKEGFDMFDVIRICTLNPVKHYNLDAGLLQKGQAADFIVVEDYMSMNVLETWINGEKVFDRGQTLFKYENKECINRFNASEISERDICIKRNGSEMRVIEAFEGELITKEVFLTPGKGDIVKPDIQNDILKIVVKDRYKDMPPSTALIRGFGLKKGAFAGSVAHDSHNIICIGTNDKDIAAAINLIIRLKGGLAVAAGTELYSIPLPVAGIMSEKQVNIVASEYEKLSQLVKSMGCTMSAPFMTLSFMALLVIPELKLSDKGLFNGKIFNYVPLFKD